MKTLHTQTGFKMKSIVAGLILTMGLSALSPTAFADTQVEKKEKGYMLAELSKAAYLNILDILPFLSTFGLSIVQQQLQPKDDVANPVLAKILPFASVIVPSAFSLSNLYARISELRDTRSLVSQDAETQNAITAQQDAAIAKYAFWIPLSIAAAFRMAGNSDSSARILYILTTYVLSASAGTESSPIQIVRDSFASTLDNFRKDAGAKQN